MSDIVGRLRVRQPLLGTLCDEAADYIERLRAELDNEHIARLAAERTNAWRLRALQAEADNERLRAALEAIAGRSSTGRSLTYKSALVDLDFIYKRARRALEQKP